jgi:hypothetical protein
MTRGVTSLWGALGFVLVGCAGAPVTYVHQPLGSPHGTATDTRYGAAVTLADSTPHGAWARQFETSKAVIDARVDRAADASPSGRDRFWRVWPDPGEGGRGRTQRLELCLGPEGHAAPLGSCAVAVERTPAGTEGPVFGGLPALVESGNLGDSLRLAVLDTHGSVTVFADGDLHEPESRVSTPSFGVWMLTEGAGLEVAGADGAIKARTGQLHFCHARAGKPVCYGVSAPPDGATASEITFILSVDVLRRAGSIRHVLWGLAVASHRNHETHQIVRCEAGDEEGTPTCASTLISP